MSRRAIARSSCASATTCATIRAGTAVRAPVGDEIEILGDANTGYTLDDVRRVMPAFEELRIAWLEEPFPAHDYRCYQTPHARPVPLAAGENHYTRFEFTRLIEDGAVSFVQPDLSKTGGVTEAMRIAAWPRPGSCRSIRTPRRPASTWPRPSTCWRRSTPRLFRGRCRQAQSVPRRGRRRPLHARRRRMRHAVGNTRAWRRDQRSLHQRPLH